MTVTETMTLILAVIMTMNVIECVCENNYMTLTRAWICNYDYVIGFVCEYKYYYYHKLEWNCVFSCICVCVYECVITHNWSMSLAVTLPVTV